ncbi:MAG: hypothetical protein R2788_10025 [Saprospiraceae bacterium]
MDDDEIVRKGDTYGWDYDINGLRESERGCKPASFRKVDFCSRKYDHDRILVLAISKWKIPQYLLWRL